MANKLDLVYHPNSILRKIAEPVTKFDADLKQLVEDMKTTMHHESGVGLAAPQVGVSKRLFVMDTGDETIAFVNPEIVEADEETYVLEGGEGCLSLPNAFGKVKRSKRVRLVYQDTDGNPHEMTATEQYAVCIQHEIDHLDGKLFIDYLSSLKRNLLERKVRNALRK